MFHFHWSNYLLVNHVTWYSFAEKQCLDEILIRGLSRNIGKDWHRLGTTLSFSAAEIETFVYNNRDNLEEQAFQMFIAWRRKQTKDTEARESLRAALVEIERADMAARLPGTVS